MPSTVQLSGLITLLCINVGAFLFFPPSDVSFHPPSSTNINRCTTENQTFTCTVTTKEHDASDIIFYLHNDDVDPSLVVIIDNKTAAYHILDITIDMNRKTIGCYVTEKNLQSQNIMRVYEMPIPVQNLTCIILDYNGNVTCSWNFGTDYTKDSEYPKVTLYVAFPWTPSYKEWTFDDLRDSIIFSFVNDTVLFNQLNAILGMSVSSKCGITQNRTFDGDDVIKVQPFPVENFEAVILNSTCMSLTWTHNKKERVKQYQIAYTSKWNEKQVEIYINETRSNKNINKTIVCGLVPWTTYTVTIKVKPLDKPGVWSQQQEVKETTPEDVPASSPQVVEGSYSWRREECLHANSIRSVVIFMKAIPKIHEQGSNILTLINVTSHTDRQTITKTTSGTYYQLQLLCKEAYEVTLQALNSHGSSVKPSRLRISAANEDFHKHLLVERNRTYDGKVHFEWNFHGDYKDGTPTVFYTKNCKGFFIGEPEWKKFNRGLSSGMLTLPPNEEPEHYCFGLAVTKSEGNPGFEWNSCQYVKDIAPSVPPADLRVVAGNQDDTLLVSWSKWLCPDGEPYISHFQIMYCINIHGQNCSEPSLAEFTKDVTFATISNLEHEKSYAIQVRAVSRPYIPGPWSEPVIGKPVNKSLKSGEISGIAIGGTFVLVILLSAVVCFCRKFRKRVQKTLKGEPIETPKITPGPKEVYRITDGNTHENMINNNRPDFDRTQLYVNVTRRQTSVDSGVPEDLMTPTFNINGMEKIYEDGTGEINSGFDESPYHSPSNQSPVNDSHINSYVQAEDLNEAQSEPAVRYIDANNYIDQLEERADIAEELSSEGIDSSGTIPINTHTSSLTEAQNFGKTAEPLLSINSTVVNKQEKQTKELSILVTKIPVPKIHSPEAISQTHQQNFASGSSEDKNENTGMRLDSSSNEGSDSEISGSQVISSYTQGYISRVPDLGFNNQHVDNVSQNDLNASLQGCVTHGTDTSNLASPMDGMEQSDYVDDADFTNASKSNNNPPVNTDNTSNYVPHNDAMNTPYYKLNVSTMATNPNFSYVSQVDVINMSADQSQSDLIGTTSCVSNRDALKTHSNRPHMNEMNLSADCRDTDVGSTPGYVFQIDDVIIAVPRPNKSNPSSPVLPNKVGYVPHSDFTNVSSNMNESNKNASVSIPKELTATVVRDIAGTSSPNIAPTSPPDYVAHTDVTSSLTCLSHNAFHHSMPHHNRGIQTDLVLHKSQAQSDLSSSNFGTTMTTIVDYVPHDAVDSLNKPVLNETSHNQQAHTENVKLPETEWSLSKSKSDEASNVYDLSLLVQNRNDGPAHKVNDHDYIFHTDISNPLVNQITSVNTHSIYNPHIPPVSNGNEHNCNNYISHMDIQTAPVRECNPSEILQHANAAQSPTTNGNEINGSSYVSHTDILTAPVSSIDPSNNLQHANAAQSPTIKGNRTNGNGYISHTDIHTTPVNNTDPSDNLQDTNTAQSPTTYGNRTNGNSYVSHTDIHTTPVNNTDPSDNLQDTNTAQSPTTYGNRTNGFSYISNKDILAMPVNSNDSPNRLQGTNITTAQPIFQDKVDTDEGYLSHTDICISPSNQSDSTTILQGDNRFLTLSESNRNPGYISSSDMATISPTLISSESSSGANLKGLSPGSLDSLSDFSRSDTSSSHSNPSRIRTDSRSDDFLSSGRSDYSSINESNEDRNGSDNQSELLGGSETTFSHNLNSDRHKTNNIPPLSQKQEPVEHNTSSSGSFESIERESSRNSGSDSEKDIYSMIGEGGCLVPASDKKQSEVQSETLESQINLKLCPTAQQIPELIASIEQNEVF